MENLLKYIILISYLTKISVEEDRRISECMLTVLIDYQNGVTNDADYLQLLVEKYGGPYTQKALESLTELYRRILSQKKNLNKKK